MFSLASDVAGGSSQISQAHDAGTEVTGRCLVSAHLFFVSLCFIAVLSLMQMQTS